MTAPTLGSEPAYPLDGAGAPTGLTIRQEFAKAAMQGILAHTRDVQWVMPPEQVAKLAVQHADALLAELAKPKADE